jgi:hypothetical protein
MHFVRQSCRLLSLFLFLLGSGMVFGQSESDLNFSDSTAYEPTVSSDKTDYLPGQVATITGSGWTLDDSVHVEFIETPDYPDFHVYDLAVRADGSWEVLYDIEQRHYGVQFTVVAIGKTSGKVATTVFWDGPTITSISPTIGPVTGGEFIQINLADFTGPALPSSSNVAVTFGGTPGTNVTPIASGFNPYSIDAVFVRTPARSRGAVNVVVTYTYQTIGRNGNVTTTNVSATATNGYAYDTRPSVLNVAKTGSEDTDLTFTVANFTGSYGDADGDALNKIQILSLPANGTLRLGNKAVTVGQEIPFTVSNINNLVFEPADNYNGFTSFQWNGSDGLAYAENPAFVNINLAPVNDAPTVSAFTKGGLEDTEVVFAASDFSPAFNDIDGDALNQIRVTSLPAVGAGVLKFNGVNVTLNQTIQSSDLSNLIFVPAANFNGNASFGWRGFDAALESATAATLTLSITAVNDAPSFVKGADQAVLEDVGARTVTSWATVLSKGPADEAGQTLNFTISNNNNALFSVQPAVAANGTLTFTPAANANGSATVTVTLKDNGGIVNGGDDTSPSQTFTIAVTAVNDAPSFVKGANQTALEDASAQTVTAWATTSSTGPADESEQSITGFIVTNNNNALFSAQPAVAADGTLTFTPAPNAIGNATVSVRAQDNGGTANGGVDLSPIQTFTITVTPVNDAPSFVKGADQTVLEDVGARTVTGWATALSKGPADEAGQTLTFTVSNDNNGLFAVQPAVAANGTLTFTPAANANGSAIVTVFVKDNGGTDNGGEDTSPSQTFTINVTPVNDPPTFVKGANQTVPEDAGTQTVAAWAKSISTGPADEAGQSIIGFTVTNNNNALFAVQPAIAPDGTLTYTSAADAFGSATVSVTLKDNGGTANGGVDTSPVQTFTITVTPVNDAPVVATSISDVTVNEDAANTMIDLAGTFTDVDNATLTLSVSGNSNPGLANATYNASTGRLRLMYAANQYGEANITIKATDTDGLFAETTFLVNVNPVNDAPSFVKGANQTVLEDAGARTVSGWATASSVGPSNESTQAIVGFIVTNDNNSLFSVQPAVATNGTLTFTPADNANGIATVTIYAQDNGGTANGGVDVSATQTFTITITPVNDAPSFVKGADQTVLEDAGAQNVTDWATALSKGPADEAGQTLTFTASNDNTGLFLVQPAIAADGTLTYTLAANANGNATVTVFVKDNGGILNGGVDTSPSQTFVIHVTPVNDAPSFVKGANQTVLEDAAPQTVAGWATAISTGPVNEAGQTLSFTASNDNNALFSVQPAVSPTGVLTYTVSPNANGSATVQVFVTDNGGTDDGGVDNSPSQTFTITVTPVNDAPTFTLAASEPVILEDADAQTVAQFATDIDDGDPELSQALTFHITGNSNPALFAVAPALSATGELTYTPADDANGSATIKVRLTDDGSGIAPDVNTSVEKTFTITVTPVNDAPSFVKGANQTVLEDAATQTVAGWATAISTGPANESAQSIIGFTVVNDNNDLFSVQPAVAANGTLTFTPALNANGSATVTVYAKDNGGTANGGVDTSPTQTFLINVTPVNDAPSFVKGANQTILEDAAPQTVANWATAISTGPANESDQSIVCFTVSTDNNGLFSVQPAIAVDGTLTYTLAPDTNGSATVTVYVKDNGGTANGGIDRSPAQTFTITVTPVNDAPSFVKGANQTVLEDVATQTVAGWATAISTGPANEASQAIVGFTVSNNNNGLFLVQPAIAVNGTLTYKPAANANGSATVTVYVKDNGGTVNGGVDVSASQSFIINVTPVNDPPVVINNRSAQTVKYSEVIAAVTVSASDIDNVFSELTASTAWKKSTDVSFTSGLPQALSLTLGAGSGNTRSWSLAGNMNVAPGDYVVRVTVSDNTNDPNATSNAGYTDIAFTVVREDATIVYSGLEYFATATTTSAIANVEYMATTSDEDGTGDITSSKLLFKDEILNSFLKDVSLVNPANTTIGAGRTGVFNVTLSGQEVNAGGKTYNLNVSAEGNYQGVLVEPVLITVAVPGQDFVNGGGHQVMTQSSGKYAATAASKMNYGFTMKWNSSGKNIQGQANIIFRRWVSGQWRTYQIKSNAINTLGTSTITGGRRADFNTKANLSDITNPLAPLSLGGGLDLSVQAFESTVNGVKDQFSVTLRSGNELWFSSYWDGSKSLMRDVNGGAIKVRNANTPLARVMTEPAQTVQSALELIAYPNPFNEKLTLRLNQPLASDAKVAVYNLFGTSAFDGTLKAGEKSMEIDLVHQAIGVYLLQVQAGGFNQIIKVVKSEPVR